MLKVLKKFWKDEKGLETAEKAALIVLALVIAVGAITAIAPSIKTNFSKAILEEQNANAQSYSSF